MGKKLNILGGFKYTCIYKSFNVFCASDSHFAFILTFLLNKDFSNDSNDCCICIVCIMDDVQETFNGRHTTQHQLHWSKKA